MEIIPSLPQKPTPKRLTCVVCDQNADKRQRKSRGERRRKNTDAAQASTMRTKISRLGHFSNKDLGGNASKTTDDSDTLSDFIQQFVPETSLEYSRLHVKSKIAISQYVMLTAQRQSPDLISVPFTIRINQKQQLLSDETLKHCLRREINASLGRLPMFWLATHRNRSISKPGVKHFHGEFLLTSAEIEPLKMALKRFYGLKEMGRRGAVREHSGKREKVAKDFSRLYAHLNWAGYATSELSMQKYGKQFCGLFEYDHFSTISADLNSLASQFYNEQIYRQFNYRSRREMPSTVTTQQVLTQQSKNCNVNGEVLIERTSVAPLINARTGLYKSADKLKCKRYAMRELCGKMLSEAYKHGIAYCVLNWPRYGAKERKRIAFDQGTMNRLPVDRLAYISGPPSQVAKKYFDQSVKGKLAPGTITVQQVLIE